MESNAQGVPGYFVWQVPGKPIAVHLHLDVVDRISAEVMRGFGAVPKRGAEVGGILLGSIEITPHQALPGSSQQPEFTETGVVRVESCEIIACGYSRGPSYLFAPEEVTAFARTVAHLESDSFNPIYPVGYFRSHTREGLTLAPEDLELLDQHFPDLAHIALLIKPYATKVSTAGVFYREEGVFPAETALEFPFRRREMTGEPAPKRRPMQERHAERAARVRESILPPPSHESALTGVGETEWEGPAEYAVSATPRMDAARAAALEDATRAAALEDEVGLSDSGLELNFPPPAAETGKRSWRVSLSLVFLLLGVALGAQMAFTLWPAGDEVQNTALQLTVAPSGDTLMVRWNRDAAPVKAAMRGVLEIEDGGATKTAELDAAHLRDGSVVYQRTSDAVHFQLIVYLNSRLTVAETLDWRQ